MTVATKNKEKSSSVVEFTPILTDVFEHEILHGVMIGLYYWCMVNKVDLTPCPANETLASDFLAALTGEWSKIGEESIPYLFDDSFKEQVDLIVLKNADVISALWADSRSQHVKRIAKSIGRTQAREFLNAHEYEAHEIIAQLKSLGD